MRSSIQLVARFMHLCLRQDRADLEDRDHRQETNEQKEQAEEKPYRADEHREVPKRRAIHRPRGRQEISMQARNDNHESLEPHSYVDDDRNDEQQGYAAASPLRPENLRNQNVAQDQRPIQRSI